MKRVMALCLIALGVAVYQVAVMAQTPPATGPLIPEPPRGSFPDIDPIPIPTHGRTPISSRPKREGRVISKGILAPSESDVTEHQFFLSLEKTGLMRLLPRESFDWEVYKVDKQVNMRGGGAFFSFHYRSHEYGWGSDISFERGYLSVGFAGADYGMLTDLGDTPLEPIVAEDTRAAFLVNYEPPGNEPDARVEARKFHPGFTVDGVSYYRRLPAKVNHTYLVRSIVYGRSDVLVGFRVARQDKDGGLIIAWKILKRFVTPSLN